MSDVAGQLARHAEEEGLGPESVARRHLLHGLLRRWSRSAHAGEMVLRGGLMTQLWAGPRRRQTRDVDFVGLYPLDAEAAHDRLSAVLGTPVEEDGLAFDIDSLRGEVIWPETNFPGLRCLVQARALGAETEVQIDVGFGDPLVPPAEWIDYPALVGPPIRLQAVRPELLTAWKLDGLFDHGARRWQPKDLYDLYLLTRHRALDGPTLVEATRVAFEAHHDPLDAVPEVVYSRAWWDSAAARGKWAKFRASAAVPVPDDLLEVAAAVARALRPALEELVSIPAEGVWPEGEPSGP
jgi:hypothetical protein